MLKILLLGKNGQLGWELQRTLAPLGKVIALDYPQVDFTHLEDLKAVVADANVDVIVNAAAYTAVDRAETEAETARLVNSVAPAMLAELANRQKAALIHISTDYVFDGQQGKAYIETDATNPLNVYGKTKLAGEQAVAGIADSHLILRTSWVYSMQNAGFVSKVLAWARTQETLSIVDDQISSPTSARMLAAMIALLLVKTDGAPYSALQSKRGIYHLAGSGCCSRYEWAKEILKNDPTPQERKAKNIIPAHTVDFPTPAVRPLYSVLDCGKFEAAFRLRMPSWQDGLRLLMEER